MKGRLMSIVGFKELCDKLNEEEIDLIALRDTRSFGMQMKMAREA